MSTDQDLEQQEKFFDAFIERRGDFSAALVDTQTSRKTFYRWLREDEKFIARFDRMRLELGAEVENNAIQRVLNPTSNRGSDALVGKLLTGLKPDRYGEKKDQGGAATIVFVSGLRDTPRPGVGVADADGVRVVEVDPARALPVPGVRDAEVGDGDAQGDAPGPDHAPEPLYRQRKRERLAVVADSNECVSNSDIAGI